MHCFVVKDLEAKKPLEGVQLRAIHGDRMTMVFFHLEPGVKVPEHSHPHEQMGTVLKGSIELVVEGEKRIVKMGEAYQIPSDAVHSGECGESPAEILEIFSPPREDFR